MKIALVAAVARGGVIGADGKLAWRISDDLKWFKRVTIGKPVIMGRKTYDTIGKPLPGRDNIVMTRAEDFAADGVFAAHDASAALAMATASAEDRGADEIFVIGGGEIYAEFLNRARRIYLTRVDADIEGDAFFPAIDSADWVENRCGACEKGPKNQHACEFFILERRGRQGLNPL